MTALRYGVLVWDADGDMGQAVVLGPFRSVKAADDKAAVVRHVAERDGEQNDGGERVQALVIDLMPGSTSARDAVGRSVDA